MYLLILKNMELDEVELGDVEILVSRISPRIDSFEIDGPIGFPWKKLRTTAGAKMRTGFSD